MDKWFGLRQAPPFASMTVNGIRQYFPIFNLPEEATELCTQIAHQIDEPDDIASLLKSASGKVFDHTSRDILSEYYTSDSIAEQLVAYALPSSYDELTALKVVDPACGHGFLVVLVAKRYIEKGRQLGRAPADILHWLLESLHGFDVQPYSVIFTRLNLLIQSTRLFCIA